MSSGVNVSVHGCLCDVSLMIDLNWDSNMLELVGRQGVGGVSKRLTVTDGLEMTKNVSSVS